MTQYLEKLSSEDRRFVQGWFATDKSLGEAVRAVFEKALERGVTGLIVDTITISNGNVTFVLHYDNGEWDSILVSRGRPRETRRKQRASQAMKKAKDILKPVVRSLRSHVRDRSVPYSKERVWKAVARDCPDVVEKVGVEAWRRIISETDVWEFTLDSIAALLVAQVLPDYKPSVLARLGRLAK